MEISFWSEKLAVSNSDLSNGVNQVAASPPRPARWEPGGFPSWLLPHRLPQPLTPQTSVLYWCQAPGLHPRNIHWRVIHSPCPQGAQGQPEKCWKDAVWELHIYSFIQHMRVNVSCMFPLWWRLRNWGSDWRPEKIHPTPYAGYEVRPSDALCLVPVTCAFGSPHDNTVGWILEDEGILSPKWEPKISFKSRRNILVLAQSTCLRPCSPLRPDWIRFSHLSGGFPQPSELPRQEPQPSPCI